MTGFVSNPPAGAPAAVANDGWWPDLPLADAREAVKLDTTVADARLSAVLVAAMIYVNRELAPWRTAITADLAEPPASLADVPAVEYGGVSERVILYRRAVCAWAKAELDEAYRGTDTAGLGQTRADALNPVVADFRRLAREAIRDFLGTARVVVALI